MERFDSHMRYTDPEIIGTMGDEEFRRNGRALVDYICKYIETLRSRRVLSDMRPGYLQELLEKEMPYEAEDWSAIMDDVDTKIMPGVTHWTHPSFFAYLPSCTSFPSIIGETLGNAMGCVGFSWNSCPAMTELEIVTLDWMARALGLPQEFMHSSGRKKGGGCFQASRSDAVLDAMLAARFRATSVKGQPYEKDFDEKCKKLATLVAYTSKDAHASVEKAAKLCLVALHIVPTNDEHAMDVDALKKAMEYDVQNGKKPFFVCATLGTHSTGATDSLLHIGNALRPYQGVWLHVDASYGGNALICPEYRYLGEGMGYADSISVDPQKWMLTNHDGTCFWVKDYLSYIEVYMINPVYLKHEHDNESIDFRHWTVHLSRRFRALPLWFVLRRYGLHGLQANIRKQCQNARRLELYLWRDKRFEVMNEVKFALVCFRVVKCLNNYKADYATKLLLSLLNASGLTHATPTEINGYFCIRICVSSEYTNDEDMDNLWSLMTDSMRRIENAPTQGMKLTTSARSVGRFRSPSRPRRDIVGLFRFLTNTKSVPLQDYKHIKAKQTLTDPTMPLIMPDTEDEIADSLESIFSQINVM